MCVEVTRFQHQHYTATVRIFTNLANSYISSFNTFYLQLCLTTLAGFGKRHKNWKTDTVLDRPWQTASLAHCTICTLSCRTHFKALGPLECKSIRRDRHLNIHKYKRIMLFLRLIFASQWICVMRRHYNVHQKVIFGQKVSWVNLLCKNEFPHIKWQKTLFVDTLRVTKKWICFMILRYG